MRNCDFLMAGNVSFVSKNKLINGWQEFRGFFNNAECSFVSTKIMPSGIEVECGILFLEWVGDFLFYMF